MILLDTHVWVWLMEGDNRLKKSKALTLILEAEKTSRIHLAPISFREVAMFEKKGRLQFQLPAIDWLDRASKAPGFRVLPLTPRIARESANLPGDFHGDPADRLLAATARCHECRLITADKQLIQYGNSGYLAVQSC